MKKKRTLLESNILSRKKYHKLFVGGVIALSLSLGSCTDSKLCDRDSSTYADGNGSTAYDTGYYQDSYDYGGDTDRSRSGDSKYACDSD